MQRAIPPGLRAAMPTTPIAAPTPRFDSFYKHDELTKLLFEYAQAFPSLAAIRSIGKSYEGRDIWVATITNTATGAAEDKPAFWADGNIHAAELTASTAVLYFLNELLTKYGATPRSRSCSTPGSSISARG
jgi:murein tripeptide amidase MpaA